VLSEVIQQQVKILEVTAGSHYYRRAVQSLEEGDVAKAHQLLTGAQDSLYVELVTRAGAHAALNFKTAMDKAFATASKKVYE